MIAAVLAVNAAAQAAAPVVRGPVADSAAGDEKNNRNVKMEKATNPAAAPEAALLEYLGRYGEAADGVDPLAFDLPVDVDKPNSGEGEP